MRTYPFPVNYFSNIFSPIKMFTQRGVLSIWQIVLILFLLNGLMVMPLSTYIGQTQSVDINDYLPAASAMIDQNLLEGFQKFYSSANPTTQPPFFTSQTEAEKNIQDQAQGLAFYPQGFIIKEQNRVFDQTFVNPQAIAEITNLQALRDYLSQAWFSANRLAVILTRFFNVWLLSVVNFIFVLLGSAFLLWLTKFGHMFTIGSFNQAFQLCLNAMGLATLLAVLAGIVLQSPQVLTILQSGLFVLILLWVYWKTHYNDHYVEKVLSLGEEELDDRQSYR